MPVGTTPGPNRVEPAQVGDDEHATAPRHVADCRGETVTLLTTNRCDPPAVHLGPRKASAVSIDASCTTRAVSNPPRSATVPLTVKRHEKRYSTHQVQLRALGVLDGLLEHLGVLLRRADSGDGEHPYHQGYGLLCAQGAVSGLKDTKRYGSPPGVLGSEHKTPSKPSASRRRDGSRWSGAR